MRAGLLLLLLIPVFALAQPAVLRIQGSNTIGAELGPALVRGLLQAQGARQISTVPGEHPNEVQINAVDASGQPLSVTIGAHGSSTGFAALKSGNADLVASSRPINDQERADLQASGDLKSSEAEQVIAIDGVAVIVHPDNPIRELGTEQLAQLFSGERTQWDSLGGKGPVHLYARDNQSGTWETFRELVLAPQGKSLSADAWRLESSEQLSDEVSHDPQAIGFIGLPYVRHARALAITDGAAQPMLPTRSLIATEDYPLSRRLYFYLPPGQPNGWAQALVRFTQSDPGQAIVAQCGFVAQTVQAIQVLATDRMPATYADLTRQAQRLSVNFRFAKGSASLDNKARADVQRVIDYLNRTNKLVHQVTLVGFGDEKTDPDRARLLSRLRAMAVRRELVKQGVVLREIVGMGSEMPVAGNAMDEGRIKNRRVEVWVH
ncbi:substrate-binding domain-containing protein [Pseudomonas sp. dw_358]|uniref:substrate-binding domain-containing protein n=1 Tax=Pseudomonas sp. dw_358 TaxID=2720083 RepID=UPI001BD3A51A|nr:substrate-binding domain-containing protein [Pseudomonas sp. dw_358]